MIFTVPVLSIMMFSGRRSWCSISMRWKACRPRAICSTMPRTRLEVGPRIVGHPLRERLALDVFHRDVQEAALARSRIGLQHVRAVHAPRDPFLQHEALEVAPGRPAGRRRASSARRARRSRDLRPGRDGCAPRHGSRARCGSRRSRRAPRAAAAARAAPAAGAARRPPPAGLRRDTICTVRLSALPRRYASATIARAASSRLPRASRIAPGDERRVDVLVDAVGGKHEHVAALDFQRVVVDLELRIEADAPGSGSSRPATPGRGGPASAARATAQALQPIDPRVADVEQVRGGPLQHQRAQRADVAAILLVAVRAVVGLRVQPGIGRREHAVRGLLAPTRSPTCSSSRRGRPSRRTRGHLAHVAGADAVGQRDRDALRREQRLRREHAP